MPIWVRTPHCLLRRLIWRRRVDAARAWQEAARRQRAEHDAAVARLRRLAEIDPSGRPEDDAARAWAIYDEGLRYAHEWQADARQEAAKHDPALARILARPPQRLNPGRWRDLR
jgi:hypothetical protein